MRAQGRWQPSVYGSIPRKRGKKLQTRNSNEMISFNKQLILKQNENYQMDQFTSGCYQIRRHRGASEDSTTHPN